METWIVRGVTSVHLCVESAVPLPVSLLVRSSLAEKKKLYKISEFVRQSLIGFFFRWAKIKTK